MKHRNDTKSELRISIVTVYNTRSQRSLRALQSGAIV